MIIVGIEPDAMAYGAILRLCAARGHPERAISLLEDMQRFQVKPTTLCFTAALKAVAKSHETSIRFENGSSRKQLRRETIAAHHGKMARSIVVMAEQAEVEQDDGFVSALMLCAAAAGDSATTKAVYLASEVRKMNQLQSIASPQLTVNKMYDRPELVIDESTESDAAKLEAESGSVSVDSSSTLIAETSSTSLPASGHKKNRSVALVPYGEREYGKDTRTLSALMHASSQAMNKNGMGTIWAGRENQGYLCDNSLRLITTRWEPSYRNTQIPGTDSTKVGIGALKRLDDIERETGPQPGKRKKFRGLYVDDDDILTIDDIDVDDDPTSIDGFVYGNEPDDHDDEDDFFGPSTEDTGFVTSDSTLPITKV
jgi:pentatricopeptide repeat protein